MTTAWIGNWHKRITQRVGDRGFDTVSAFADSQPTASLRNLADQLSEDSDIAPIQVERVLVYEAQEMGMIESCARRLLVRRLHEKLPEGWHLQWDGAPGASGSRLASACSSLCAALPEHYQESYSRIRDALWSASIPEGWLPAGPDDPVLLEIFQHWDAPA